MKLTALLSSPATTAQVVLVAVEDNTVLTIMNDDGAVTLPGGVTTVSSDLSR